LAPSHSSARYLFKLLDALESLLFHFFLYDLQTLCLNTQHSQVVCQGRQKCCTTNRRSIWTRRRMRSSKCATGPVSTEVAVAHHQARSSTDFPSQLLAVDEAPLAAKDDAAAILAPPNIIAATARPPSSNSASMVEEDEEEEQDDGPASGAATLHHTYNRPKNACRKSCVNYNSSSSYNMSSMSHDPAAGSSTRAARLPPYPYVREPSIPPLQHPLSGAGRRSKKQADK
jgi:hypothetical protein